MLRGERVSDFECFIHFPKPTGIFGGFVFRSVNVQIAPKGTKEGEKVAVKVE